MKKSNLVVAVSATTLALFGAHLHLLSNPQDNSLFSANLVTSVQADPAYNLDANWNESESKITLTFDNPGSFEAGRRSSVKFKINGSVEDFRNGNLGLYVGSTQTLKINIDENGEGVFELSEIVDTEAVLSKFFTIRGSIKADFTIDIILRDSDSSVVSDAQVSITAPNENQEENHSSTPSSSTSSSDSSAKSTTDAPTSGDAKPGVSPDLFQIDVQGTTATLYWTPGSTDISSYFIAYGLNPGSNEYGVVVENVNHDGVNSFEIRDLAPNTTYYFSIRAQNNTMPGDWSSALKALAQPIDAPKKVYYKYE